MNKRLNIKLLYLILKSTHLSEFGIYIRCLSNILIPARAFEILISAPHLPFQIVRQMVDSVSALTKDPIPITRFNALKSLVCTYQALRVSKFYLYLFSLFFIYLHNHELLFITTHACYITP